MSMSRATVSSDCNDVNAILTNEILPTLNNTSDLNVVMSAVYFNRSLNWIISCNVLSQMSKGRELKSAKRGKDALKKAKKAIVQKTEDKKQIYKKLSFARRHCLPHEDSVVKLLADHNPYNTEPKREPLLDENADFPFASKKLTMVYSKTCGRRVICNADVVQGEILMVEPAFQFVLVPGEETFFCDACAIRISSFIPCQTCSEVVYCSEACRLSVSSIHEVECGYVTLFSRVDYSSRLLLKILLATDAKQQGMHAPSSNQSLRYNKAMPTIELLKLAMPCLSMVHFLQLAGSYFKGDPSDEVKLAVAQRLLLLQLQLNAHAQGMASYFASSTADEFPDGMKVRTTWKHFVGMAIYTSSSMISQSCDPNVHIRFSGNRMIAVAVCDLEEGDEIFICLGPHYKFSGKNVRQKVYMDKFGVKCSCVACTLGGTADFCDVYKAWKCGKCSGPAILPEQSDGKTTLCMECGKSMGFTPEMFALQIQSKFPLFETTSTLMDLINKWRKHRKLLYHSHESLIDLTQAIRAKFMDVREWQYVFQVSEALVVATENRYFFPSQELAKEFRITSQAAHKAAKEAGYQTVRGMKLTEQSIRYDKSAVKTQYALCGLSEMELDIGPVFMDNQYLKKKK